jgi:phage major head subunit gpT-like protein
MIINQTNLDILTTGFKASYQNGFKGVDPFWKSVATMIPSSTRENAYAWLGQFPMLRQWLGERQIQSMLAQAYTLTNQKFEATVGVKRDDIDDDQYGVYNSLFTEYGRAAATHPDVEIFAALQSGETGLCYDGQPFFSADHPVGIEGQTAISMVSNDQGGAGPRWYLMDTTRPLKPMIYQKRDEYEFIAKFDPKTSDTVFMLDEYLYGIRGRMAPGYGFWQMAQRSAQPITAASVEAAYTAITSLTSNEGRKLGLKPNVMLCGPSTYFTARALIEAQIINATSNTLYKLVEVVNVPYLD